MKYDMSDKLKFAENPVLKITDKVEVTVRSDAETVLKLMGMMSGPDDERGSMQMMAEAGNLLFSPKDYDKIKHLKLNLEDYLEVINTAITLASGEDPDEAVQAGEE